MASNRNEETKTLVEIHEMKMKGYHLVQWKQWKRVVASDQGNLLKGIVIWFLKGKERSSERVDYDQFQPRNGLFGSLQRFL